MRHALITAVLLAACGGDDGDTTGPDDGTPAPDASPCPRDPAAADRERLVIVAHPYTATGAPASEYQVLTLSEAGELADAGTPFQLGRSFVGEIAFTPDGEVAIVAQDDGTLGVVRFDAATPVVVHAAFEGGFYASRVVMDPRGDRAYVLDNQWRENGGGVHRVAIGCDGTLTDLGRWFPAKLPAGLHLLDAGSALLVANDVGESVQGNDVHLLDWYDDPPERASSGVAFGDDDAIVSGSAVTADGELALIGDGSAFSGVPNRVAVVGIATSVELRDILTPLEDPIAIVASPFDDVALVVSGFGDAVFVLDRAGGTFTNRGELTYVGASPQLPGGAVMIDRGELEGLVLVAENLGVRRIRMSGGGTVTDLGLTALGAGTAAITGAIGVQP